MEPINNPAECVICMVTAVEMTEKVQLKKEWRWRFCPLTFRGICSGRINNHRIQWLWLCLMTLHRKKKEKKEKTSSAVQKYCENCLEVCVLAQSLSLSLFSEGKQINVLHLVRGPSGYITRPWQEAPKPGFLPRFQDARQIRWLRLTS